MTKYKVPWHVKIRVAILNWFACGYIKVNPEDLSWNEYNKRWTRIK